MANKSNSKTSSEKNSDSNPFPKLKPMGSIYINQIPKKDDKDKTTENLNSFGPENESNFLSKLKIFDPHPNIHPDTIKHSRTFLPSYLENDDSNKEKGNAYNFKEKGNEEEEIINIDNENKKLPKKLSAEINIDNNNINKKVDKRLSAKNPFDVAKKFFHSISGYVNDNIINKINFNKNDNEKKDNPNQKDLEIIFEKPLNFEEIEKQWYYEKLLLDNNILDFTSKSYKNKL